LCVLCACLLAAVDGSSGPKRDIIKNGSYVAHATELNVGYNDMARCYGYSLLYAFHRLDYDTDLCDYNGLAKGTDTLNKAHKVQHSKAANRFTGTLWDLNFKMEPEETISTVADLRALKERYVDEHAEEIATFLERSGDSRDRRQILPLDRGETWEEMVAALPQFVAKYDKCVIVVCFYFLQNEGMEVSEGGHAIAVYVNKKTNVVSLFDPDSQDKLISVGHDAKKVLDIDLIEKGSRSALPASRRPGASKIVDRFSEKVQQLMREDWVKVPPFYLTEFFFHIITKKREDSD